jgi:uncharacterized protein (TIGR03118 family)
MATAPLGGAYASPGYVQRNLISDTSSIPAAHHDPTLLNPWGVAFFPGGPFWINDNGSGISALYNGDGTGAFGASPAIAVKIPPPKNSNATSFPTGIVANDSFGFNLTNGNPPHQSPALFIFATEDGTISAWNLGDGIPSNTNPPLAELKIDNSKKQCSNGATGAVYKGLAEAVTAAGVFIYATNFRCASVDVFTSTFQPALISHNFHDSQIPDGYAPFGIANVDGNLIVTYAMQDANKHDDVAGPGNGFVDIYDANGFLIKRFAQHGVLNSPWGIAEAPFNFGEFSNDILIGNFGNGWINAFHTNGAFHGTLTDKSSNPIAIDGLWSVVFGGGTNSSVSTLYFTSGPNGEADGLVGTLSVQ